MSKPTMRSMIHLPRMTGEVVVPLAVTFRTLAWVIRPPRGLLAGSVTRRIETPPEAYASLPAQCERVRALTHPDDALLVLSDRAGTVLWTCDRRGTTLTPATAMGTAAASTRFAAAPDALWRTLESADHVFLPFPDLAPASLREFLDREWQRDPGEEILLYERRGARPAATP